MFREDMTVSENTELKTGVNFYKPAFRTTLDTIQQRNQNGQATFLLSSQPVFAESAQTAYLLSEYINDVGKQKTEEIYKSFFCNSSIEALHGAIKIARHNAVSRHRKNDGLVLICDQAHYYQALLDPLTQGEDKALVPGVRFYENCWHLFEYLNQPNALSNAVVVCLNEDLNPDELKQTQELCFSKQCIFVLDTSRVTKDLIKTALKALSIAPDIVIWGEELTDYQVPFAAFSVIDSLYKVWSHCATCFIHSSTYGGNSLVTSIARDRILDGFLGTAKVKNNLQNILHNANARKQAFRTYINPITPLIYQAAKLDLDIVYAKASKITIKDPQGKKIEVIDCIGGAGSNLRGYNPEDVQQVVNTHQTEINYWAQLSGMLIELTGFNTVFPAVSGAGAVDIGFTMAMLANPERTRILVFKGNYAGKTLISLNGTEESFDRKPFSPLYWDVVYLDLFSANAEASLKQELLSGKIALVWFEVMQGNSLNRIPVSLMEIIFQYKECGGYFIGIDEILNGIYRTGDFFSFDSARYKPDIVTLSKGLSDLTFPISATLVRKQLYQRARQKNMDLVTRYETLFINQLGAQVSLNGLTCARMLYGNQKVKKSGDILRSRLSDVVKKSPFLKEIRGEGLHLQLVLDMERFPLSLFGKETSELIISRLCLSKGGVLQYFCRLLPPLNISEAEIEELAAGIEKALQINRFFLLIYGIKHIVVFLYLLGLEQLKSKLSWIVK